MHADFESWCSCSLTELVHADRHNDSRTNKVFLQVMPDPHVFPMFATLATPGNFLTLGLAKHVSYTCVFVGNTAPIEGS